VVDTSRRLTAKLVSIPKSQTNLSGTSSPTLVRIRRVGNEKVATRRTITGGTSRVHRRVPQHDGGRMRKVASPDSTKRVRPPASWPMDDLLHDWSRTFTSWRSVRSSITAAPAMVDSLVFFRSRISCWRSLRSGSLSSYQTCQGAAQLRRAAINRDSGLRSRDKERRRLSIPSRTVCRSRVVVVIAIC